MPSKIKNIIRKLFAKTSQQQTTSLPKTSLIDDEKLAKITGGPKKDAMVVLPGM